MRLIDSIQKWRKQQVEKKMAKHRERNTCPDCYGRGYTALAFSEAAFVYSSDQWLCPGCGGSGKYTDWEAQQPLQ